MPDNHQQLYWDFGYPRLASVCQASLALLGTALGKSCAPNSGLAVEEYLEKLERYVEERGWLV